MTTANPAVFIDYRTALNLLAEQQPVYIYQVVQLVGIVGTASLPQTMRTLGLIVNLLPGLSEQADFVTILQKWFTDTQTCEVFGMQLKLRTRIEMIGYSVHGVGGYSVSLTLPYSSQKDMRSVKSQTEGTVAIITVGNPAFPSNVVGVRLQQQQQQQQQQRQQVPHSDRSGQISLTPSSYWHLSLDSRRSEAFSRLKPYCVQLTREHTRENIAELFNALQAVDNVFLQDLQEYVIFPLRIILKQPKKCSQDLYLDLYTCMEYVLGHTRITRWDLFQDIFNTATTMLSCPTDQSKVAKLSEELKLAIIQTLRTLVKNSECSVVQQLYTLLCLPLLGHSVSLLLNIAEIERARNLRILAMELSQCMKADIGNMYASFLPGISKAIYVWMRIISLVLDDKLLELYCQKQAKKSQDQKDLDDRLAGLIVTRDSTWLSTTSSNLCVLVKQVTNVRAHCNWRVRLGLVECAEHLLLHCNNSLKECVPHFLEILVSLIGDDYAKVSEGSRHALELFSSSQAVDQQHRLTEILEENLHKLATSLPRRIQTAGNKVKNLLLSLPHLKKLSLALVQILEMECSDVKIVEERTTITGHGSSAIPSSNVTSCGIVPPKKYFKRFTNERIFDRVRGVCQLLGYHGDVHLLVDHFLDIFHETSLFKLQATLVINEIMLGTTGETAYTNNTKNGRKWQNHSKDELCTVVRMLVDEYLNPANFDLVTSLTTNTGARVQTLDQQLRSLAITLPSPKLGDETAYISNTAFIALWDICHACRYRSIDELIRENADYLMNSISLRLRHLDRNRRCPLVLKVMLQYSSAELLPLIDDTVQEILDSLDDNYAEEAALFMGVLNELAKAVVRWYPEKSDRGKSKAGITGVSANGRTAENDANGERKGATKGCSECGVVLNLNGELTDTSTDYLTEAQKSQNEFGESDAQNDLKPEQDKIDRPILKDGKPVGCKKCHVDNISKDIQKSSCSCNSNSDGLKTTVEVSSVEYLDEDDEIVHGQFDDAEMTNFNFQTSGNDKVSKKRVLNGPVNCVDCQKTLPTKLCAMCSKEEFKTDYVEIEEKKKSKSVQNHIENTGSAQVHCEKVMCASCKFKSKRPDLIGQDTSGSDVINKKIEELAEFFSNLLKLEKEALGEITEEELNNFNPDSSQPDSTDSNMDEPETKPPLPSHIKAVKEVMLRCKHIISSRNPRLRLLVLDTVSQTCVALRKHEDELLPLIHKVWPAFSLCFADEEKLVIIKTEIRGSDLDLIVCSCLPYLHIRQPTTLQKGLTQPSSKSDVTSFMKIFVCEYTYKQRLDMYHPSPAEKVHTQALYRLEMSSGPCVMARNLVCVIQTKAYWKSAMTENGVLCVTTYGFAIILVKKINESHAEVLAFGKL
ncbi:TTI1-like protein [Mya arenaria]|uniref:TTI1-like protein n=1 Tax=Mya arenaria TaxID=6604 RepID=A0ABY7F150_MYAAR|nr:TTI1-like protein [Mya arenaria]